jgi:hypothetical protein
MSKSTSGEPYQDEVKKLRSISTQLRGESAGIQMIQFQ